jgi:hypothetical protein
MAKFTTRFRGVLPLLGTGREYEMRVVENETGLVVHQSRAKVRTTLEKRADRLGFPQPDFLQRRPVRGL